MTSHALSYIRHPCAKKASTLQCGVRTVSSNFEISSSSVSRLRTSKPNTTFNRHLIALFTTLNTATMDMYAIPRLQSPKYKRDYKLTSNLRLTTAEQRTLEQRMQKRQVKEFVSVRLVSLPRHTPKAI